MAKTSLKFYWNRLYPLFRPRLYLFWNFSSEKVIFKKDLCDLEDLRLFRYRVWENHRHGHAGSVLYRIDCALWLHSTMSCRQDSVVPVDLRNYFELAAAVALHRFDDQPSRCRRPASSHGTVVLPGIRLVLANSFVAQALFDRCYYEPYTCK